MQLFNMLCHILEVDSDGRFVKIVDSLGLHLGVVDIKFDLSISLTFLYRLSLEQYLPRALNSGNFRSIIILTVNWWFNCKLILNYLLKTDRLLLLVYQMAAILLFTCLISDRVIIDQRCVI